MIFKYCPHWFQPSDQTMETPILQTVPEHRSGIACTVLRVESARKSLMPTPTKSHRKPPRYNSSKPIMSYNEIYLRPPPMGKSWCTLAVAKSLTTFFWYKGIEQKSKQSAVPNSRLQAGPCKYFFLPFQRYCKRGPKARKPVAHPAENQWSQFASSI